MLYEVITEAALQIMWQMNPELHILLTVSPVPLVATASGDHVLVATQYSKSVLRAVAGDMARSHAQVDYFPSYEIIAAPPSRATFFEPNMRAIAGDGADLVMRHFFAGLVITSYSIHYTKLYEVFEGARVAPGRFRVKRAL